jgi:hypothetical protein
LDGTLDVSKELNEISMNSFFNKQLFYILLIALSVIIAILVVIAMIARRKNTEIR